MDQDLDLVTCSDESGNEITLEVLDYFFYEGDEYAMLHEYDENACEGCEANCDTCANKDDVEEVTIMKVVPVGDDEEEFEPIDDELAQTLIELVNNGEFDDDDDLFENEPDDQE